jgi:hypothetical protein
VLILTALAVAAGPRSAEARRSAIGTSAHPFGLGGILGSPSGVSLKCFVAGPHAFDAAAGLGWLGGPSLHVHADYLFHFVFIPTKHFDLPLYFGIGAKASVWEKDKGKFWGSKKTGTTGIGIRVPFGVAFHLKKVRLDPFAELVPGLGLLPGPGFSIDTAAGVRYYF